MVSETVWLYLILGTITLISVVSAVYALLHSDYLSRELRKANDQSLLATEVLRADDRVGFWVWSCGKLESFQKAWQRMGLPCHPQDVDSLVTALMDRRIECPNGAAVKDIFFQTLRQKAECDRIFILYPTEIRAENVEPVFIGFKCFAGLPSRFPSMVMWVSPVLDTSPFLSTGMMLENQTLFRASPVPGAVLGPALELIDVNDAYCKAANAETPQEVVRDQMTLWERPPHSLLKELEQTQLPCESKLFGIVDKERRKLLVSFNYIAPDRILATFVDVTGEEEANKELKRVLDSQSETLNRLRTPVAIFGSDQNLRYYNDAFTKMSHLTDDWLSSGVDHSELMDALRAQRRLPEQIDFQSWKTSRLRAYTNLVETEEELWHLSDGTSYRVVVQPYPFGGLLMLAEDFTDRLALERNYNTLIAVQNGTIANLRDAVAVFGSDTSIKLMNPPFRAMWSLPQEVKNSGLMIADIMPFIEKACIPERKRPLEGATDFYLDLPAWTSDGQNRSGQAMLKKGSRVDYSLKNLPDGDVMLTFSDVTDSYRIESALRERTAALEAADRMKAQFITSMSYELRTPLNSIIGFSEILQMGLGGTLTERAADYVDNILTGANRLKDMISDVLDLAVLESGDMKLELEKVDFSALLQESKNLARELCAQSNVKLSGRIKKDLCVQADRLRLKQVFLNLISAMLVLAPHGGNLSYNLIDKYSKKLDKQEKSGHKSGSKSGHESSHESGHELGPELGPESGRKEKIIRLSVRSDDCGINTVHRDRLIETLLSGAIPEKRRTTGLDLALVRSIVHLHGGKVEIKPVSATGICISLIFSELDSYTAG